MSTCGLVAAADFNEDEFKAIYDACAFDYIIAVDAGYEHLVSLEVTPDLVVGDFDSLGYVPTGVEVRRLSTHKDNSDLDIAMTIACEAGFDELYVFGALGGRLDHTISNLQDMAKCAEAGAERAEAGAGSAEAGAERAEAGAGSAEAGARCVEAGAVQTEAGIRVEAIGLHEKLNFLVGPASLEFSARESGTISVFALNDVCKGVSEHGLMWELEGVSLTNRSGSHGLSNEFCGKPAKISVQSGTLLVLQNL